SGARPEGFDILHGNVRSSACRLRHPLLRLIEKSLVTSRGRAHFGQIFEARVIAGSCRAFARQLFPSSDDRVAIDGIIFDEAASAAGLLGSDQRRSGAAEAIKNDLPSPGAISN